MDMVKRCALTALVAICMLVVPPRYMAAEDEVVSLNDGIAFAKSGEYLRAIDVFSKYLNAHPDEFDPYYLRAITYLTIREYEKCASDCDIAISIMPDSSEAYSVRGEAHINLGVVGKALNDLNKAIELNQKNSDAYFLKGVLYSQQGQYTQAMEYLEIAYRLRPEDANTLLRMADIHMRFYKYDLAMECYDKAIQLSQDPGVYNARGKAYLYLRQPKRAVSDFEKAIQVAPDQAEGYHNRALAYFLSRNYSWSKDSVLKAVRLGDKFHPLFLEALERELAASAKKGSVRR